MPLSIVLFYVLCDRYSFWEEDITKVYKHREGNANPQVYTDPNFRVNIIFIMLDTMIIHFIRLQHMPNLNTKQCSSNNIIMPDVTDAT